jgi:hypothetical protein
VLPVSNLTEYEPLCGECGGEIVWTETVREWRYCAIFKDGNLSDTYNVENAEGCGDGQFICNECGEQDNVVPGKEL